MRTLFFEVLNTLVRLSGFEAEVARLIRDELNLRVSLEEVAKEFSDEWRSRYNMLLSKGVYRSLRQLARETVISIVKRYSLSLSPQELDYFGNAVSSLIVETSEVYDDVAPTLEELEGMGVPMYILTNLDNDVAKKILLRYNIMRHFKGVVSSDLTRVGKPAVKIFQAALNRARVSPQDALIVSGLPEDIIGARLLEIKVAFVRRTGEEPPMRADYELMNLRELAKLLTTPHN